MSRFDNDSDNDTPPTRLVRNKTKQIKPGKSSPESEDSVPTMKKEFEPVGAMGGANIGSKQAVKQASDKQKTVLFKPSQVDSNVIAPTDRPITAWLVIVSGPGKGASLDISYGLNKIGRDNGEDIVLAFGDEKISRTHHAAIEFDPKERKFYLSKGENLVYLNGSRVGSGNEMAIETGDQIELGETTLQFVAFCGPKFDWNQD